MTVRFATAIHAVGVQTGGELVVVDLRDGACLRLNASGARIWRGLESGLAVEEIAREIAGRFGIDQTRAAADVAAFLEDLRARGLLAS